jgi:hypothetical protein
MCTNILLDGQYFIQTILVVLAGYAIEHDDLSILTAGYRRGTKILYHQPNSFLFGQMEAYTAAPQYMP